MNYYDGRINDYLIKFMSNAIDLEEFKKWFNLNNEKLEHYLYEENYFNLLNTDFASTDALNSVKEQIQLILDTPSYDHINIRNLLEELISQEEKCIQCCRQIYEAYCNGYYFLKEIALISISYDYDHRLDKPDNINGLLNARPIMILEAESLLEYMKLGEIKIVEEYWVIDSRKNERNT